LSSVINGGITVNFGVPQNRKRMILVGSKKEFNFEYPKPTHFDLELENLESLGLSGGET
jgi:site-specific DNA-cytosine methylase